MNVGNLNRTQFILPARSSTSFARFFGILILLFLFATVSAHPPSDMALQYQSGELTATIVHDVADPAAHYVYRVTILINGVPLDTFLYQSQPPSPFSYQYQVPATPGDVIEVTADCNIAGSISRQLVVGEGQEQERPAPALWPYHALPQTLGFILLFAAILLVEFGKKIQGWYRWHKLLAYAGSVLIVAGLAIGIYMVGLSGGPHIRVPHSLLGALAILLISLTLILGIAREKLRPPKQYLRTLHIVLGIITFLFLIATIILADT